MRRYATAKVEIEYLRSLASICLVIHFVGHCLFSTQYTYTIILVKGNILIAGLTFDVRYSVGRKYIVSYWFPVAFTVLP